MSTKKKYKRDYIILEAKDMNFRYKDRVLPKAFAKVEVTEDKSLVALYVENLKYVREGYKVVAILEDYNTVDLGNIVLSEQGKGEFALSLDENTSNIKSIALTYDNSIPLIGFKGSKLENYEELIFAENEEYGEYEEIEDEDSEYEYEEVEYIDVEDEDSEYEYEYLEYIEVEDDENQVEDVEYEYVEPKQEYVPTNNQRNQGQKQIKHNKQVENIKQISEDIEYEEVETTKIRNLLMPRQIKKGLKMFKEVKPFANESLFNVVDLIRPLGIA